MKRPVKNGLITSLVAFTALGIETLYQNGLGVSPMIHVLGQSVLIGVLVTIAVSFMDKEE